MIQQALTVAKLKEAMGYQVLCGDTSALQRKIVSPEINRPGLELVGFFEYTDWNRGMILGKKELTFILKMDDDNQRKCFESLTHPQTPFIIISRGQACPEILVKIANEKNVPVLSSDRLTSNIITEIMMFVYERLSPQTLIHGTLVELFGLGVLLCGESGIGKSEMALELIRRGHRLVTDDSVIAYTMFHRLYGKAPVHLKNFLEVRGLGVINVTQMFGVTSLRDFSQIDYIIELGTLEQSNHYDRFATQQEYRQYLDVSCPIIRLPVTSGRNMADLIEVAVTALRLKAKGMDANKELMGKYDELVANGGKNDD